MANTIKFGNGHWATKEDSILAYNDENANFKPLPFVTSRASTATTVNKSGLLETVASGVPRVDYLGNSKGSYLIEGNSTNLITQSEAFGNTYWTKSGASIEGDPSTAGSEEVVNGDFATDSDWTKGTGWSIGSGVASCNGSQAGLSYLNQSGNIVVGKMYKVTYDLITVSAGEVRAFCGGVTGKARTTTGTYTEYQIAGTTSFWLRGSSTFVGSIDNVSVKEVSGFSAPSVDTPLGAFKLVLDNGGEILKSMPFTVGTNYTFSFYAKTQGGTFDFSFGNISYANTTATATNEWKRFEITQSAVATTRFPKITTSSSGEMLIFGAQIEQNSYATSYIPTNGSQISRLSETASQTVPDGIIGQTEGTVFLEITRDSLESYTQRLLTLSNGTTNNIIGLQLTSENQITFYVENGGSNQVVITKSNATTANVNVKIGISYKANDFVMYIDGVQVGVDTSGSVPTTSVIKYADPSGSSQYVGAVNELKLYNTRLSNSELQTLTTI